MRFNVREVLNEDGRIRVRGYAVLWGGMDLYKTYFTPETKGLLDTFNAVKKLPWFYDHTTNKELSIKHIGLVDTFGEDEYGLWYEAEIQKHEEYKEMVRPLVKEGVLGSSSGTFPLAGKAKNSEITQWVIAEVSGTVRPADPRHVMTEEELSEPSVRSSFLVNTNDTEEKPNEQEDNDAKLAEIRARIGVEKMRMAVKALGTII